MDTPRVLLCLPALMFILTTGCGTTEPCQCVLSSSGGPVTLECGVTGCIDGVGYLCAAEKTAQPSADACTSPLSCQPKSCAQLGANCGQMEDGCGHTITCGTCSAPESCGGGGQANQCGCSPESTAQLCARLGATCGTLRATDRCGTAREVSCGTCATPQVCGGGGVANTCACTPESNAAFCARKGTNCGSVTGLDNCQHSRTVNCGSCTTPNTCGGSGVANVCGQAACVPETEAAFCSRYGKNCGLVSARDNCGTQRVDVDCGTCWSPQTCGGATVPNVCGCTPESNALFCSRLSKNCGSVSGTDNCGSWRTSVSCGSCTAPQTCGGGGSSNVCGCNPESDAAFLQRLGKNCGSVSGTDNCGQPRTVTAASCPNFTTCGGGGTPNVCGCTPQTDADLCSATSTSCGSMTVVDQCGTQRVVSCGACGGGSICPATGPQNRACTCPTDYTMVNGVCQPVQCANANQRSCGGSCVSCPSSGVQNTTCVGPACIAQSCLDGWGLSGGVCIQMSCSVGTLHCTSGCASCPLTGASSWGCDGTACIATSCAPGYSVSGGRCVDVDWLTEVIDTSADQWSSPPRSAALALDASGNVYAAYADPPNLVIAQRTSNGWVRRSVTPLGVLATPVTAFELDGAGNAHVIYFTFKQLSQLDSTNVYRYLKISPAGVTSLALEIGETPWLHGGNLVAKDGVALAVDANGDAHLAYNWYASGTSRLRYRRTFQNAWLNHMEAATTEFPYPAIKVDATGTVHLAGVSGNGFLYTQGVASIFSAPISSGPFSGLEHTLLWVSGSTVQIWAKKGRDYYSTSLSGSALTAPSVWGTLPGSPLRTIGAPHSGGFIMLEQSSKNAPVIARSGPTNGPSLVEDTNLQVSELENFGLAEANGTFHGLAWKTSASGDQLTYIRGH